MLQYHPDKSKHHRQTTLQQPAIRFYLVYLYNSVNLHSTSTKVSTPLYEIHHQNISLTRWSAFKIFKNTWFHFSVELRMRKQVTKTEQSKEYRLFYHGCLFLCFIWRKTQIVLEYDWGSFMYIWYFSFAPSRAGYCRKIREHRFKNNVPGKSWLTRCLNIQMT